MSAVASAPRTATSPAAPASVARAITYVVLGVATFVAFALLALSLVPSATLAARLLGTAGEARSGAFSQEFAAHVAERLRLACVLLLAPTLGLVVTHSAFEDMLAAVIKLRVRDWSVGRWTVVWVGGLSLLALVVRLPFLSQPMRYDEALTFNEFASRPLYYGLSYYPDPNNHLLNTLLMHASFLAFGNQPWALRLPALFAGVLLTPATFALGRLLFGFGGGVLAAALMGVSSYVVEYSTNARGYTLQALSFVVMLTLVIVAVRQRNHAALFGAAVVGALGAYAVPTMAYGVAVAAAWLLIERRVGWRYVASSGLTLALLVVGLYLPPLIVSGPENLAGNRFVVPLGASELVTELPRTLAQTWALWNRDVPLAFAAVVVVGFAVGSWRAPIGVIAAVVCLACVIVQRVAPFERVWLFLLPLYFTVAAGGLARFVDGRVLATVFAAVLGFFTLTSGSILTSPETGVFPDAESVARTLGPRLAPDDAVVTQLPASLPELQYYFPRFGLATATLVRDPAEAANLWVIAPPANEPSVNGWRDALEIARFGSASVYELKRAAAAH